jgi:hypothetical protein
LSHRCRGLEQRYGRGALEEFHFRESGCDGTGGDDYKLDTILFHGGDFGYDLINGRDIEGMVGGQDTTSNLDDNPRDILDDFFPYFFPFLK